MEVLELKPIKNKEVTVYLVKSSDQTLEFLKNVPLSYCTADLGKDYKKLANSTLGKLMSVLNIPMHQVDMPQHAKDYLYEEIVELDDQINELLEGLDQFKDKDSHKAENIKCWVDSLTEDLKEKKKSLEMKVRPQWIVKKILDLAKKSSDEKISIVHVTKENIFAEILTQLKVLGIEVVVYAENIVHLIPAKTVDQEGINQWKF